MKNKRNLVTGRRGIFSLALLSFSLAVGGTVVRAENSELPPPSFQKVVFDPIADALSALEQRFAAIETTVIGYAGSFASEHIATNELCIADDSGAKTCISKAQLDALLKMHALQFAKLPANTDQPAVAAAPGIPPPDIGAGAPAAEPVDTAANNVVVVAAQSAKHDEEAMPQAAPAPAVPAAPVDQVPDDDGGDARAIAAGAFERGACLDRGRPDVSRDRAAARIACRQWPCEGR